MNDKINILGVGISQITKKDAVKIIDDWISRRSGKYGKAGRIQNRKEVDSGQARMTKFIVTPNPEMLVEAQKDEKFKDILNRADMAIPDGVGLVWASKIIYKLKSQSSNLKTKSKNSKTSSVIPVSSSVVPAPCPSAGRQAGIYINNQALKERVSGTDLMLGLCELASQKGYTIGLLGAGEGVAQRTAEVLKGEFPGIKIKFAVSELPTPGVGRRRNTTPGVCQVDLLFVAFGAPKQEKWIWSQESGVRVQVSGFRSQGSGSGFKNKSRLLKPKTSNLKANVYMGVGGAFDFISGQISRAPMWMQNLGLEWLYRLIQEPKRIGRIWNATVVFPWLVFRSLFKENKISQKESNKQQNKCY